jgi:crossover junction endonuclease MUS81
MEKKLFLFRYLKVIITFRGKIKSKNDEKMSELSKNGILFEVRHLNVGDFMWIARCKFTNRELVLPYIVERKRIDDLSSSIKDGRYHEQKVCIY